MAAPAGFERALTTDPYYRSAYAFVYRRDKGPKIKSFDDPALRDLKIGVQLTGGANTPPTHALARRHLIENVTGYPVFDESEGCPSAKIVAAVAEGEVDVAVVWGPPAGYFAKRQSVPLEVVPVSPQEEVVGSASLSFAFDICMGVRRGDKDLRDRINATLARRRDEIGKVLDEYGVPRVPAAAAPALQRKEKDATTNECRRVRTADHLCRRGPRCGPYTRCRHPEASVTADRGRFLWRGRSEERVWRALPAGAGGAREKEAGSA